MEDDIKLWLGFWKIVVIAASAVAISMASCTANRHYQTRVLLESGKVDPVSATCAMLSDIQNSALCILRGAK